MTEPGADRGRDFYDETILSNPEIIAGERIDLHAERAHVVSRDVRGRLAIITRRAVKVRKTIEVDVMHEELDVRYEPGDGTEMIGARAEAFSILLRAEEVEVIKRVRVVEEAVVSKKRVVEQTCFDIELRHERLDVLGANRT